MDQLDIRWRRPYRAQVVPEHNEFTETPVVANPYPSWLIHFEPTKKTKRSLRTVPVHNVYPLTPPYIAWAIHFEPTENNTNRRLRETLELNTFPATPAGYYDGYYPGSEIAQSLSFESKRKLQVVPELNTYPATPAQVPLPAWGLHFEPIKNLTNHKQINVELNTYPETPAGYYSGYYPGSLMAKAINSSFDINEQKLPELNVYPSAVVVADITAWNPHFEKIRNRTNRRSLGVELNQYTQTPAGYYSGFFPGSEIQESFKWTFKRVNQVVELDQFTPLPTSAAIIPAFITHFERISNKTNRRVLGVQLNSYPQTVPVWTVVADDSGNWSAVSDDGSVWTGVNDNSNTWVDK